MIQFQFAVICGGILFLVISPENFDSVNPFISEESRYFLVTQDGVPHGSTNM